MSRVTSFAHKLQKELEVSGKTKSMASILTLNLLKCYSMLFLFSVVELQMGTPLVNGKFLTNDSHSWEEARTDCKKANGRLACVPDGKIQFLGELMPAIRERKATSVDRITMWYSGSNCVDGLQRPGCNVLVTGIESDRPTLRKGCSPIRNFHALCENAFPSRDTSYTSYTWSTDVFSKWDEAQEWCEIQKKRLACWETNSSALLKSLENDNSTVDSVTFWYSGRSCLGKTDVPGSYMTVEGLKSQSLRISKFKAFDGLYQGLCEAIDSPTVTPNTVTVVPTSRPICCQAKTSRNVRWNEHCENEEAIFKPCPEGAKGLAKWFCNTSSGQWLPRTPYLEDCTSGFFLDFNTKVDGLNVTEALNLMSKEHPVYGGDLLKLGSSFNKVVEHIGSFLQSVSDPEERKNLALSIMDQIASLVNSVLLHKATLKDLTEARRVKTATNFFQGLEEAVFQYAKSVNGTEFLTIEKEAFTLEVIKKRRGSFENGLALPQMTSRIFSTTSRFVLPSGFEQFLARNDTIVIFFIFKDLRDVLVKDSNHSLRNVSPSPTLNSPVLSISLNGGRRHVKLETYAQFTVPFVDRQAGNPICVFWNLTSMDWDTSGCRLLWRNVTHVDCACDHLTIFAVLMDVHDVLDTLTEKDLSYLETLTRIGCSISIAFLTICIVVKSAYRTLGGMDASVHLNLCFSLLIAEGLFIFGAGATNNKMLCAIFAGLLHFFFLSAFCWMFLEAVLIYQRLYKVFQTKETYAKRFYAVGYGVPLLIVVISATYQPDGYGNDKNCWLKSENTFLWGFFGPVSMIILVNFAALVFALRTADKIRTKRKPSSGTASNMSWILGALTISPLLGSTWILGFTMIRNNPIFVYLFTALNSFQGLTIFIAQCILHENTRKCVMKSLEKYCNLPKSREIEN